MISPSSSERTAVKVVMFAEKLPPEFTGSGKQAVYLSRALTRKNVGVTCLCSSPSGTGVPDYSEGFPIFRLKSAASGRIRSLQFVIGAVGWLLRNTRSYDILHVHGYCWATFPAMVVAKIIGKRTLYKVTLLGDDDPSAIHKSGFGRLKSLFFGRFDGFIAISDRIYEVVRDFLGSPEKVFSIPNGVESRFSSNEIQDSAARRHLCERFKIGEQSQIVLFVGSIEHRKGIDLLAESWAAVVSEFSDARLFLVGPYSKESPFYRWFIGVLKEHINRTVFLVGTVEDTEAYYKASDLFVFPSRSEGLPNVVLEAMASGRACIVSRIEGVTDSLLSDGYDGVLVNREDQKGLEKTIIALLRDSALRDRLALNAANTVEKRFRIDCVAEKYIEVYERLLRE